MLGCAGGGGRPRSHPGFQLRRQVGLSLPCCCVRPRTMQQSLNGRVAAQTLLCWPAAQGSSHPRGLLERASREAMSTRLHPLVPSIHQGEIRREALEWTGLRPTSLRFSAATLQATTETLTRAATKALGAGEGEGHSQECHLPRVQKQVAWLPRTTSLSRQRSSEPSHLPPTRDWLLWTLPCGATARPLSHSLQPRRVRHREAPPPLPLLCHVQSTSTRL